MLRARDLVEARYAEPLGVADLARMAGLSRAHFSREFKRAFGESPHAYLLTRRLERAAALLRATDRSVAAIWHASCGRTGVRSFYTEKRGWELRADVTLPELGNYRWLTVGPPGQADVSLLLNAIPGPPVVDAATGEQIRSLMAKGWAGNVLLTTDDAQASYEELTARGIEFTEPPEERPYGIDSAFRDPSGNQFRMTQVREPAAI